ncbi:MAG: hypothetical protein J2P38_00150 [Candidatus Dormibacteraeota bacterium]|nr:hypothetical protein [Candidatus Dormibacteraeota bacterium]
MNESACAGDLTAAYEALRAQATGQLPSTTPRGLALCLSAGLPVWMKAWTPLAPQSPPAAPPSDVGASVHAAAEVVRLLTEMALACQQGSAA